MNLHTEHAKEILGKSEEWAAFRFEIIGGKLFRIDGAVAPFKLRGKCKGMRNWKKLDKATEATAYYTTQEHDYWLRKWEQKTGKCSECAGFREVFARWSVDTGTETKPCAKCSGTGKPT